MGKGHFCKGMRQPTLSVETFEKVHIRSLRIRYPVNIILEKSTRKEAENGPFKIRKLAKIFQDFLNGEKLNNSFESRGRKLS